MADLLLRVLREKITAGAVRGGIGWACEVTSDDAHGWFGVTGAVPKTDGGRYM